MSAQHEAGLHMTHLQNKRVELEQSLQAVLAAGSNSIGQQVRYILASAQTIPPAGTSQPSTGEVMTSGEARLLALAQIVESLTETERNRLLNEARALPSSAARLDILLYLVRYLPQYTREPILSEIWTSVRGLVDSAARARVLFHLADLLHALQDEHAAPASLVPVVTAAQAINNAEARIRSLTAIVPHLPHNMRVRMLHRLFDDIDRLHNDRLRGGAVIALAEFLPEEVESRALRSAEFIQTPVERARTLMGLAPHLPPALQLRLRADALDAIQAVMNEDERAEVLIAFAPHLDYVSSKEHFPVLWEQTLAVVNGLSKRPLRARALVALAPHLTAHLLTEALSVVHSLPNEHDRAALLAELAPTLLVEQVVACAGMARAMHSVDARILALTALARRVPEELRHQIARDVLSQVMSLSNTYERVTALIALTEILPLELHAEAYTQAFDSVLNIENENARARAMSLLGSRLPSTLLARALEAGEHFSAPNLRISVLSSLTLVLIGESRNEALRHLLDSTQEIQLEYKRARALVSIAPLLSADLLQEVHVLAEELDDPFDRVIVYIAIAQNLPPDQRPPIIAHAWTLIKEIEGGYDSASAIAAISLFLPESLHADLIQIAGSVIGAIRDEYDRASAIGILAPLLLADDHHESTAGLSDSFLALEEGLSAVFDVTNQALRAQLLRKCVTIWMEIGYFAQSYRLWGVVALRLAQLPLADSMLCLSALMPVLYALTGEEGRADIARELLAH
jgi:hypothetical protein